MSRGLGDVYKRQKYYSANFNGRQRSKKFNINKYQDALASAIEFRKQKELEHGYL